LLARWPGSKRVLSVGVLLLDLVPAAQPLIDRINDR
jgi:hypothetical protein